MNRFIIFICLLSQVMVANAAFAPARCAHADMGDMGQMTHAMHGVSGDAQAKQASDEPAKQHCKCLCDLVGHCAAATAGAVVNLNPTLGDFPPVDISRSTPPSAISNAHKNRLYRPPSSI